MDEALVSANRLVGPARRLQGVLCVEERTSSVVCMQCWQLCRGVPVGG